MWGPCNGLIITRYGYERPLQGITLKSASHPVPDEAGLLATRELRAMLERSRTRTRSFSPSSPAAGPR
jgi:glycerate 2-kinase